MMRYILALAIGVCAGYTYGFTDAQHYDKPLAQRVTERIVDQVGGKDRERFMNDADKKMNDLQRH
jgi:hypothetical protein